MVVVVMVVVVMVVVMRHRFTPLYFSGSAARVSQGGRAVDNTLLPIPYMN